MKKAVSENMEHENIQIAIHHPAQKKKKTNKKGDKHKKPHHKTQKKISHDPPAKCGCDCDCSGNGLLNITDISETHSGNNWTGNNVSTLLSWLTNANYNIECLDLSIEDCSKTIRHNVILGLMMSTGAGTISTANMGIVSNAQAKFILNIIFTVMAFIIAINTGRIKVYQIQERLEQFIKLKQEWTYFITTIAVEFQTPVNLRKDALLLILNNKEKYLDLMKRDCEFTEAAKREMSKKIQQDTDQWFLLNNEFYNSHVSLLNFSKGIRINDLVDSMSYFEGINLIQAEKSEDYDPNANIAPLYDKVDKYKVIRHFYEVDMEEKRVKSMWELFNEYLFPKYYEELRIKKKEDMYKKRRERIRQEVEEEEKRIAEEYAKRVAEQTREEEMESDISEEEDEDTTPSEEPDIENQIPTAPPKPTEKGWFEYLSPFSCD